MKSRIIFIAVLILTPLAWSQDVYVYQKNLGTNAEFFWDYDSVIIGCSVCDQSCSNCVYKYDLNITPQTKSVQCGDGQFSINWQWPKVIVTGGCGAPKEYIWSFRFRGIRTSDGATVFQGETPNTSVTIPFVFGEAEVRLEVAARVVDGTGERISEYATSISTGIVDGQNRPWIVKSIINQTTDFVFEGEAK